MKKLISLLVLLILLCTATLSYSEVSKEELINRRSELIAELTEINTALGAMVKTEELAGSNINPDENLGSISSLFPDENLAMFVRDQLQKFSISQPVTQAELDTITSIYVGGFGDYHPSDLTGIKYLRNAKKLDVSWQSACTTLPDEVCELIYLQEIELQYSSFNSLPENIGNLTALTKIDFSNSGLTYLPSSFCNLVNLKTIDFSRSALTSVPDDIGNLTSLSTLDLSNTSISSLPESIGSLISLKKLYVNNTNLQSLPESIGNLVSLNTLNISHTAISSLPDSIWNLKLTSLDMSGTSIK